MAPKVVLITGCSTGMGLVTAVQLAGDKDNRFKVFATMRNLAKKEKLETAAGNLLNKSLFIRQLDVTKEDSIKKFMEKINKEEGGVDILINNAGIGQAGIVETVTMDQIKTIYETNVYGVIRMTQEVIPGMKAKKSGHIITVASVAGLTGVPFCDIYVSSKFAVEGFSESIAPVLRKFNISVSVIEPGPVQTEFGTNISSNNTGGFSATDDPNVDELTKTLQKTSMANSMKRYAKNMQSAEDIANIIQDAILSDKPHLHYPTSDAYKKLLGAKFVDVTGDSVVDGIVKSQGWD